MTRAGPLWTGEIRVAEDVLAWPLRQHQPRLIVVNRMSDVFHENITTKTIDLLHAIMRAAHWHRFLVLTKRSRRMRDYYSDPGTPRRVEEQLVLLPSVVSSAARRHRRSSRRADRAVIFTGVVSWPLANLWLGVSVEDQERILRIADLLQSPAALRWVCFEPLLERVRPEAVPVGDGYFDSFGGQHYAMGGRGGRRRSVEGPAWQPLDWVVIGGETGAGSRPMQADWVRRLRDQCAAAGIPLFFRRWGEWAPMPENRSGEMTRVGTRAAGRVLDGRTWDELPQSPRMR